MVSFALITEGLTDQIVIEYILSGYFNSKNIVINPLQPERDKDNENKSSYAGWTLVFDYFKTKLFDFKGAFQFNDYIIIQIDTDVSEEKGFDISKRDENGNELTPDELIIKVKHKLIKLIGEEFYQKYSEKIIFAISVNSIECWFLPIYYQDNKKAKIVSCLKTLNRQINQIEGFTIDQNNKNPQYYRQISENYLKQKQLLKYAKDNPSFKVFITEIKNRNIVIND